MMAFISGNVLHRGVGYLIIEQGGIGYCVSFPETATQSFQSNIQLYLHEVVREAERELFGFTSIDQLELFWKLIEVSGVGPRIAQKIVYSDDVDAVRANIMTGDISALSHVSGVGKKTAQKIILELKGVLAQEDPTEAIDQDAVEALIGLGYKKQDAQATIAQAQGETTEEKIRSALKGLGM